MVRVSRVNLLGIRVTPFDLNAAVAEMAEALESDRRTYASTCPVYTLMQGQERPDVREALNGADWVTPDGMPVVWAIKALGATGVGRVYGPDLMAALSELSAKRGWAQYYLGGAEGVAEQLARTLQSRYPGLEVAGTYCPPFRALTDAEEQAMVDHINASGAHILWAGLGSPKQDLWMARHRPQLVVPLLVGVGAAFDFFTGRMRQAPPWMQRSGLEWLFRLINEPRRLWRRYVIYNSKFIFCFVRQWLGSRRDE